MRILLLITLLASIFITTSSTAFAQGGGGAGGGGGSSIIGSPWPNTCLNDGVPTLSCIPYVFKNIILAALVLAGVTALIFIIFSGYKYITSEGDPKKAEGARKTLTYAIIGLILILLSFFIVAIIANLTGVDCIREFGFDNCGSPAP